MWFLLLHELFNLLQKLWINCVQHEKTKWLDALNEVNPLDAPPLHTLIFVYINAAQISFIPTVLHIIAGLLVPWFQVRIEGVTVKMIITHSLIHIVTPLFVYLSQALVAGSSSIKRRSKTQQFAFEIKSSRIVSSNFLWQLAINFINTSDGKTFFLIWISNASKLNTYIDLQ